ncbi:MAG: hypothetical protein H6531_05765 [Actinobacteria bacterium]|nr:hypothetical protein [Thermoleophilia bacterium]MCB9011320.1 hypothetical protein [Actinomycetota bacterium]
MSLRVHGAAVLIGAALLATPVLADSGANAPFGIVNARGTGTAIASGQMVLVGVVRGPATIVIRDRVAEGDEGAASLRVGGREVGVKPWAPSAPFTTVRRVSVKKGSQRFILSATDAWIQIRSPRMSLAGSGRFTLRFKGKGTHQIDSNQRVPWNGRRLLRVGDTGQATTRSTR